MSPDRRRQVNVYKGTPARAWIRLQLISSGNDSLDLELLVDTGNPCSVIVSAKTMERFQLRESVTSDSNFGSLHGGWLHIAIQDLGFDEKLLAYSNDRIVEVVKKGEPVFDGLVGLPLLRMLEYGGDQGTFGIERIPLP